MYSVIVGAVTAALLVVSNLGSVQAQAAAQIGAAPPKAIQTQLCTITDVFGKLQDITTNEDCRSGCGQGECPPSWMPTAIDECNPQCGLVFEPFWDQCGEMLVQAHMGGMEEMGIFYDDCLEELYPPGSCGAFCNEHTYDCFLTEVQQSCCDEEGTNCREDSDVPNVCPVGCAIVFPEFLETCRDHVAEHEANDPSIVVAEFEAFEQQCLTTDGLALVEYALDMVNRGCILDLSGVDAGGHRRLQHFLMQRFSSTALHCAWDQIDDLAQDVTSICCENHACSDGHFTPNSCSPGCAVALHQFTMSCESALRVIDRDYGQITAFEQSCLNDADPLFFLDAIKNAQCDGAPAAQAAPPPAPTGPATIELHATSAHGDTMRLYYTLDERKSNIYAVAGTADTPMTFPAAFQVAAPFGADIGGVNPAFFAVNADAQYDSWLTIGPDDGQSGSALTSIGIDFDSWTMSAGLRADNGAVFWLDTSAGPSGTVLIAQITGARDSSASVVVQGQATAGEDWGDSPVWSWDGAAPPPPPPAPMGPATTELHATSAHGDTMRLYYTLDERKSNIYAIAGTADTPMTFPAAFQVAAPFGADIGGVNPAFFAVNADAQYDSWLTIGPDDGQSGAAIACSPDFCHDFDYWSADAQLTTTNGAVFWMAPDSGPSGTVLVAQITGGRDSSASAMFQGRATDGSDWQDSAVWRW